LTKTGTIRHINFQELASSGLLLTKNWHHQAYYLSRTSIIRYMTCQEFTSGLLLDKNWHNQAH
jgi:hypothetical protein